MYGYKGPNLKQFSFSLAGHVILNIGVHLTLFLAFIVKPFNEYANLNVILGLKKGNFTFWTSQYSC